MNTESAKQMLFQSLIGTILVLTLSELAQAEPRVLRVEFAAPDAAEQWSFTDERATIANGALQLDGSESPTYAFLKAPAFGDVTLSAKFQVEPHQGVHAVGFVIGSTDSLHYHYVHFDKQSAILCRSDVESEWHELGRSPAHHEPGPWYKARLERRGTKLSVYFADELLYEADAPDIQDGLIGF